MEMILQWVTHYGYAAIFFLLLLGIVGLPVPDESLLTFVGYLAYKHQLALIPAYASASLGSMCGITVSYGLGRSLGLFILHHYGRFLHVTPEEMDKVHDWFGRFGRWTLLMGYFIPGIRHLTAVVAGTSRLRPLSFAIFAYSGALLWAATFVSIGFFFGDHWSQVLDQVHEHLRVFTLIALALLAVYLTWHYRRFKRARKKGSG
jgi:membrane protein DedA with SNARE-associated domain